MEYFDNVESEMNIAEIEVSEENLAEEPLLTEKPETIEPSEVICDCELCQNARERIGVTPANVRIRFVANAYSQPEWDTINEFVDISQIPEYHIFVEQGNPFNKTLFTTDSAVTDFQFLSIGYCFWHYEPCCFDAIYVDDILFSLDMLSPEKPLLVEWTYMGCFTSSRGVSFVYDGVRHYFEIAHSNYNSHLFLAERNKLDKAD